MLYANTPAKIEYAFAYEGDVNVIPVSPGSNPRLSSWQTGFPSITSLPLSAGGLPPAREDFNGILNVATASLQYTCMGGTYMYDSAFSTLIGGYPKYATLMSSTGNGFWINTVDNNTTDPDSGGASGWIKDWASGGGGSGVSSVSVATAHGFSGTSSGGTTPALTLSTTVTGMVKGSSGSLVAATAGTDYVAPGGSNTWGATQIFNGGIVAGITLKNTLDGSYTVQTSDVTVVINAEGFTLYLPAASSCSGQIFILINASPVYSVTCASLPHLSVLTAATTYIVQSIGTTYAILSSYSPAV
jgi:hypothetical protein